MKKLTRKAASAAFVLATILGVATTGARADDEIIETSLKVPFSFIVGDVRLPAGDYTVREVSTGEDVLEIVSVDGHHVALASTIPGASGPEDQTQLVFQKFGSDYFLARITHDGNERDVVLTPHIIERQIDKAARAND